MDGERSGIELKFVTLSICVSPCSQDFKGFRTNIELAFFLRDH